MNKPEYALVSLSGGKDSTAMLLGMLERGMKIDCILFCDTGLEFPAMYDHLAKLERDIGRPITRVRADQSYEYLMFETSVKRKENTSFIDKYGNIEKGYGWAGPETAMVYHQVERHTARKISAGAAERIYGQRICRHSRRREIQVRA